MDLESVKGRVVTELTRRGLEAYEPIVTAAGYLRRFYRHQGPYRHKIYFEIDNGTLLLRYSVRCKPIPFVPIRRYAKELFEIKWTPTANSIFGDLNISAWEPDSQSHQSHQSISQCFDAFVSLLDQLEKANKVIEELQFVLLKWVYKWVGLPEPAPETKTELMFPIVHENGNRAFRFAAMPVGGFFLLELKSQNPKKVLLRAYANYFNPLPLPPDERVILPEREYELNFIESNLDTSNISQDPVEFLSQVIGILFALTMTNAFRPFLNACATCGRLNPPNVCSACPTVMYCNRVCQKKDWDLRHKTVCPFGK